MGYSSIRPSRHIYRIAQRPPNHDPCPDAGQREKGSRQLSLAEDIRNRFDCEDAKKEIRPEAISVVRGVQLTPLSRNKCGIRFDFAQSANPHAKLPTSTEVVAERFETPTGHYWVIR